MVPAWQVALPEEPPWWELFDVTQAELAKVCRVMTALYQQPKAEYVPLRQLAADLASPAASPLPNGAALHANGAARPGGPLDSSAERPSPADAQVRALLEAMLWHCLDPCMHVGCPDWWPVAAVQCSLAGPSVATEPAWQQHAPASITGTTRTTVACAKPGGGPFCCSAPSAGQQPAFSDSQTLTWLLYIPIHVCLPQA